METYLVQRQVCHSAKLEFLVLSRVRGLPVCCEPVLQDVGGLLWEIAASLAVESVVIDTNVLLEPDVIVARFVSCRRLGSVLLVGVVH